MSGRPKILSADAIAEIKAAAVLRRTLCNKALAIKYGCAPATIKHAINDGYYKKKLARKRVAERKANAPA